MNKKNIGISVVVVFSLLLLVGTVFAHQSGFNLREKMGSFHEQMESIMEKGSYEDLQALREEKGFNMMPFISNEDSFQEMKEHHEEMEAFHEKGEGCPMMEDGGSCPMMNGDPEGMMGMHSGMHKEGHHEGCPMMNN